MRRQLLVGVLVFAAVLAPTANAGVRDDTAWLQAKLDAGGTLFLPKLPNSQCYRTRGLWVSRDDTSITSDGACILATGRGEARIKTGTGLPIRASGVFFLNHSSLYDPLPVRVRISGVHIVVPGPKQLHGIQMDGIDVSGHEVAIDNVSITGQPGYDVRVGGGTPGSGGMSERIAIRNSVLRGAIRNVVSVVGPIDLQVEGNTLSGGRGETSAGVRLAVADRGQPALDVRIARNTITDNGGPGIFLNLTPKNGAPVFASGFEITGNRVLRNARLARANERAGIVLAGGQRDGRGTLTLADNVVSGNRGAALLQRHLRLVVAASRNDLRGAVAGTRAGAVSTAPPGEWSPSPAQLAAAGTDDTAWLQARLDAAGGTIFLPALPNGRCYATRGLWVSHDDTTITSDGACIVSLGPGAVRLHSIDGDPIASNGIFFLNRSSSKKPTPVNVTISNLRLVVSTGQEMYGVATFAHEVTLSHLDIGGAPIDDVLIGGRANGNGYVGTVAVLDSTLSNAARNGISAFGVFGLRVERNVIQGVRDVPAGEPAAGIDVEPDERSQPTLDVHIVGNTIVDNAGPGVLLSLESNSGPSVIATDIEVSRNKIERNSKKKTPPTLAGVAVVGGQDDGLGTLALKNNTIKDNGGPGILFRALKLLVDASGNDLGGNRPGP